MDTYQIRVILGMYARNEAKNLPWVLKSVFNQTRSFQSLIFLNDGSTDNTEEVFFEATENASIPIHYWKTDPHENYLLTGKMHLTGNYIIEKIMEHDSEFFMILGGDTCLDLAYLKCLLHQTIYSADYIAISSGSIRSEPFDPRVPRGSGRLYHTEFMRKYSFPLPSNSIWESYPLYKALSLGYKVKAFKTPEMFSRRRTLDYKAYYGYAMKQLGYFPLYAYLRCLKAIIKESRGINMLRNYRKDLPVYDLQVQNYLIRHQIRELLSLHTKIW